MNIRQAEEKDLAALADLYRETVLAIAPQRYTPAQTEAWAGCGTNNDRFRHFILEATTYVVEDETGIVGFAGIEKNGHVSSAYVRSDRIHQGIGSKLMQILLDHAAQHHIVRLYGEASEFSLGLFKKFGFQLYATELFDLKGTTFTRYLVERLVET